LFILADILKSEELEKDTKILLIKLFEEWAGEEKINQ